MQLSERHKANIVAIQETKLNQDIEVHLPNYSEIRKVGHFNRNSHCGVITYIHSSIPYKQIDLDTPLQAVAATVQLRRQLTICNIYSSDSHPLSQQLLQDIYNQLPKPCLLLRDFNAHNVLWGSRVSNRRGREVERVALENGVHIMNDGTPTRIGYQSETAIDLSLCSPELNAYFQWSFFSSPGGSDYCAIIIRYGEEEGATGKSCWNMKQANWDIFRGSDAWKTLPEEDNRDCAVSLADFYERMATACKEAIPQSKHTRYYPKPWWTPELTLSKQKRERNYQQYRHNKTMENLLRWKRNRAEHKKLVKKSKRLERICGQH